MKLLFVVLVSFLAIESCNVNSIGGGIKGDKNVVTTEVTIGEYTKLVNTGQSKIVYEQQQPEAAPYCRLEIDANLQKYVSVTVENNELRVSTTKSINSTVFNIYTNSKSLSSAKILGSGGISLKGKLATDKLALEVRGSGSLNADNITCLRANLQLMGSGDIDIKDLSASTLYSELKGSGDVNLKGIAGCKSLVVRGSGDIDAYDLLAKNADCLLAGSGSVKINVSDSLKVSITGSGDVFYKGSPKHIEKSVKGSGDIHSK